MMQRILVLGQIPGTNYEVSLEVMLCLLVFALAAYRIAVFWAVNHYSITARYRLHKAEKLLSKHQLV